MFPSPAKAAALTPHAVAYDRNVKVSLHLYAGLRELLGARDLDFDVDDGATIADLQARLAATYPAVQPFLKTLAFAIDDEFVDTEERIHAGADIALIPPVSGGAPSVHGEPGEPPLVHLTHDPLEAAAPQLVEAVRTDDSGAVAVFYGVARNHSEGRAVERLEYEARESMALRQMQNVVDETKRRFPAVAEIGVWHRIGILEIGEASLLVAVASPHRAEAFEACHWFVDRLKQVVPIWKKEHWTGGAAWVEGHPVEPPETAKP